MSERAWTAAAGLAFVALIGIGLSSLPSNPEVVVPFDAIPGLDPAGLMGVHFSAPLGPGEFAFTIDRVGFR